MPKQQDILNTLPTFTGGSSNTGMPGTDVTAFTIQVLNPDTSAVQEVVVLRGTDRPFSPITTPITQEIHKTYYPGSGNRTPTMQVMGGMEDNVRLNGVFEARWIQDANRREEPTNLVNILNRITREGNVCLFQIGPWIRYGFIENFTPVFKTKSMYQWSMDLMIVGTVNPLDKSVLEVPETNQLIFSPAELSDLRDITETVTDDLEATKNDLEQINYLPVIKQDVFNIPEYVTKLDEVGPIGRIAELGTIVYNGIRDFGTLANSFLDNIDRFINSIDSISKEATKLILTLENLRSRVFRQSTNLFNAYNRITSGLDTATRIGGWGAIAPLGGIYFNMGNLLKGVEDRARQGQSNIIVRTHVVKASDTLQIISTRYYGDWERWRDIRDANNLPNSDLNENQILVIPE